MAEKSNSYKVVLRRKVKYSNTLIIVSDQYITVELGRLAKKKNTIKVISN